jgi:hypothetical protein
MAIGKIVVQRQIALDESATHAGLPFASCIYALPVSLLIKILLCGNPCL